MNRADPLPADSSNYSDPLVIEKGIRLDETSHIAIRRTDYRAPPFRVEATRLSFDLQEGATTVTSAMDVERSGDGDLVLDGQDLQLLSIEVDGRALGGNEYRVEDDRLTLFAIPDRAEVRIVTRIEPEQNTALEGLYRSGSMYCTQCEAEGFRKITYYPDRPDVLSRFTTTIEADAQAYPVLLSNGNLIEDETHQGRRRVTWEDPFPKPSYLFALVAGDLAVKRDTFVTAGGREVRLEIYSEPHNIEQCDFAMGALRRAMRWDEQRFGREYDLDVFMIVAVEDFNMGAMENKGLNIFNTSAVLASPDTAVDAAYQRVEAIIGHEYFHNWSGNRVTCRDWFQLSLKEGFTVFRDAEFTADMHSRTVKRIDDVNFLRSVQFAEDAGPLAHSIRPDSYIEISNFYTTTIYEKGAEVVRMLQTVLGVQGFRAGSDLYFDRHDGSAATTEDFVAAMEEANEADLGQFRRWYEQAGTPLLRVDERWRAGEFSLEIEQVRRDTPNQNDEPPLHIPVEIGLIGPSGEELVLSRLNFTCDAPTDLRGTGMGLHAGSERSTVRFTGLDAKPYVSFLRGFSAPVKVEYPRPAETLAFLAAHDPDGFARWDALQTLLVGEITGRSSNEALITDLFAALLERALRVEDPEERTLLSVMLKLPSESYLFEQVQTVEVDTLVSRRDALMVKLASEHLSGWRAIYEANIAGDYRPDAHGMSLRALKITALGYLCERMAPEELARLLEAQLEQADNLTDRMAALVGLCNSLSLDASVREAALAGFFERWQSEALVVNHWFAVQAGGRFADAQAVQALSRHQAYDQRNPNKVRSIFSVFAQANARNFHAPNGLGYTLLADKVLELNTTNPQVAARLCKPLAGWRRFEQARGGLMKAQLERLRASEGLSNDVFEVVSKSL